MFWFLFVCFALLSPNNNCVGCHHQLNGHEFEQTPGDSEGQESLVCYSQWGGKESDRTSWLTNNKITIMRILNSHVPDGYRICLNIPFYQSINNVNQWSPVGSNDKESACNAGGLGWIPVPGRFPWKREWLPTPVFLSGEFHGHRSLAGYNPWGHKESDMTEQLSIHNYHKIKFTCLNYLFW